MKRLMLVIAVLCAFAVPMSAPVAHASIISGGDPDFVVCHCACIPWGWSGGKMCICACQPVNGG